MSSANPKATLCVPAFNAGRTIAGTLESLLGQTYCDSEIIVSDNHSTDDTRDVVAGYRKRGVRLVTCPNRPFSTGSPLDNTLSAIQNWNSLFDLGTGAYVGIYHADDIYEPGLVARQVEVLERRPDCSAVFPTFKVIDGEGRLVGPTETGSSIDLSEEWFGQVALIQRMLRVGHNVSSSGPMIRRTSWRQAGRFDAVKFEQAVDTEFWTRLAGIGPIAVLKPALVRYRLHPERTSLDGFQLYRHRPLPIIPVLQHWVSQDAVRTRLDREDIVHLAASCSDEYLRISINLCRDGHRKEAREILDRLPTCGPSVTGVLWRDHRLMSLARLFAGKMLLCALHCGVGEQAASVVARSRLGFPQWQ